jgi:hypothetical protein
MNRRILLTLSLFVALFLACGRVALATGPTPTWVSFGGYGTISSFSGTVPSSGSTPGTSGFYVPTNFASATAASISANKLSVTPSLTTAAPSAFAWRGQQEEPDSTRQDQAVQVTLPVPSTTSTNSLVPAIALHCIDSTDYYVCYIRPWYTTSPKIYVIKVSGGVSTTLLNGASVTNPSTNNSCTLFFGCVKSSGTNYFYAQVQDVTTSTSLYGSTTASDCNDASSVLANGCSAVGAGYYLSQQAVAYSAWQLEYNSAASAAISPTSEPTTTNPQSIAVTGTSTSYSNGTTGFGVLNYASVAGAPSVASTTVSTTTAATVSVVPGATGGCWIFEETGTAGTSEFLLNEISPTFAAATSPTTSPLYITTGSTGNVLTLTGTGTAWAGQGATPFVLGNSQGAAGSITAQSVTNNTSMTVTITAGSTGGDIALTDQYTGETLSLYDMDMENAGTSSALYFSPNWVRGATTAYSVYSGAYIKANFTGTALSFTTDTTGTGQTQANNPLLYWTIDGANYTALQVAASTNVTALESTGLVPGNHVFQCVLNDFPQNAPDRWATPTYRWIFDNIGCDGTFSQPSTGFYAVQTPILYVYGDSICEGKVMGTDTGSSTGISFIDSIVQGLAAGLGAEYANFSFIQQGYTVAGSNGAPQLSAPGSETTLASSSWSGYDANHSLLTSGTYTTQPTYVVCLMGTNDGPTSGSTEQASVAAWLTAVRVAAPSAYVFVCYPFAGIQATNILAAYNTYQVATPDSRAFLIQTTAIPYMPDAGVSVTLSSADGTHPRQWIDELALGNILAAIQADVTTATAYHASGRGLSRNGKR